MKYFDFWFDLPKALAEVVIGNSNTENKLSGMTTTFNNNNNSSEKEMKESVDLLYNTCQVFIFIFIYFLIDSY